MREISFTGLKQQYKEHRGEYNKIFDQVLENTDFIGAYNNQSICKTERAISDFISSRGSGDKLDICLCNSGTTSLYVLLMALGVGKGDEVILPDFNFIAALEAVLLLGANPVMVDVSPFSFMLDLEKAADAVTVKTKAVIYTDIFGRVFDPSQIDWFRSEIEKKNTSVFLVEDAAQSFGAYYRNKIGHVKVAGTYGDAAITSFYPVKPLGTAGEGGAVMSHDKKLIEKVRFIINHGAASKYNHQVLGFNGRLDVLKSEILRWNLQNVFVNDFDKREAVARLYDKLLSNYLASERFMFIGTCKVRSANAQYTLVLDDVLNRDAFIRELSQRYGIPCAVHYPASTLDVMLGIVPRNEIEYLSTKDNVTDKLCKSVFSLPIHAYLTVEDVLYICDSVNELYREFKNKKGL
jgi:UDP-2-acetamido-2-deoxy-ribo-hexuluronate aminotransferase